MTREDSGSIDLPHGWIATINRDDSDFRWRWRLYGPAITVEGDCDEQWDAEWRALDTYDRLKE